MKAANYRSETNDRCTLSRFVMSKLGLVLRQTKPMKSPMLLLCLGVVVVGCAGTTQPVQPPQQQAQPKSEQKISTTPILVTPNDAGTAEELFEKGRNYLSEGKHPEAIEVLEAVAQGSDNFQLTGKALYYLGNAYEAVGDREKAINRYDTLLKKYPDSELTKPTLIKLSRNLITQEKWNQALSNADKLLQRGDLSIAEAIEANGAKGYAAAEIGDMVTARRFVERARDYMEKNSIGIAGKISHEVTQVYFALAEIERIECEKINFNPPPDPPEKFPEEFERRAQKLLDAQRYYTDAMRTTDATWATMAGYRVGKLYQQLHQDVMAMNGPARETTAEKRDLADAVIRVLYKVLLVKGLKMMTSTVGVVERTHENSVWAERALKAKSELEQAIAEQEEALKRMGYTEKLVQEILDKQKALAAKKATKKLP